MNTDKLQTCVRLRFSELPLTRLLPVCFLLCPCLLFADPSDHDSPNLFIGGGGVMCGLYKEFIKLAGEDAPLVVIPSGDSEPDLSAYKKKWEDRGFEHVYVLHTDDRNTAATKSFVYPLTKASAVWISGGVQQNLAKLYADTLVEKELINLIERGGTIGGSSAGASIQTKAMICGGTEHPQVLRGLDILQGAIVDQHFLKRNRLPRLIDAIRDNPDLVGYGIDEGTALVVEDGQMRVVGRSYVLRIKVVDGELQVDAFKDGDVLPLPTNE